MSNLKTLSFWKVKLKWTNPKTFAFFVPTQTDELYSDLQFWACQLSKNTLVPLVFHCVQLLPGLTSLSIRDTDVSQDQIVNLVNGLGKIMPRLTRFMLGDLILEDNTIQALARYICTSDHLLSFTLYNFFPARNIKGFYATMYTAAMQAKKLEFFSIECTPEDDSSHQGSLPMASIALRSLLTLTSLHIGHIYDASELFCDFWTGCVGPSTSLRKLNISKNFYSIHDKLTVLRALTANKHLEELEMSSPFSFTTNCIIDEENSTDMAIALFCLFQCNTSLTKLKMINVGILDGHTLRTTAWIWDNNSTMCDVEIYVQGRFFVNDNGDNAWDGEIIPEDDDYEDYKDAIDLFGQRKILPPHQRTALTLSDESYFGCSIMLDMHARAYKTEHLHLHDFWFERGRFPYQSISNLKQLRSLSICNTNLSTM